MISKYYLVGANLTENEKKNTLRQSARYFSYPFVTLSPSLCLSHILRKSVTLFRLMTTMIDLVLNTREDKLSTCQNAKQGIYLSSSATTSVR